MLVTTYQHDFVPPHTKRYEFLNGKLVEKTEKDTTECQCIKEQAIDAPKKVEKQCAMEWSGIAPMGRLIDPRIIPTKFSPEQLDAIASDEQENCFKEQPNRFLKILRTAYPDLYERLQQLPKEEVKRRLERQRMFTTYQIDFGNINEYPEGVYESLKDEDETSKLNASKLLRIEEPCAEFRYNVMHELAKETSSGRHNGPNSTEKVYKPFKISFADSARFINSGNNSHWRGNVFSKKVNLTEYMDSINKIGCVIMKNKIHDHQKCTGKHCSHQLTHTCTNMKSNKS